MKKKICVVGSGKWGTAVAKLIAENVDQSEVYSEKVHLYVYEEIFRGEKLSDIINRNHTNPKHLPHVKIPNNIEAIPCIESAIQDADILVFVLRQQFLAETCDKMKGFIKKEAIGISLTKSIYHHTADANHGELRTASDVIRDKLQIDVSVLMGPNLADEIAKEKFSETTIGCKDQTLFPIWKDIFSSSYFVVRFCKSVREVELCGALKNIVAAASGICDGLRYGENCKAAIIRLGFQEMKEFIKLLMAGQYDDSVLWEPCGFADLIATCYGGVTRKVVEQFAQSKKTLREVEKEHFNGMVLEGPENVKQAYHWLQAEKQELNKFPLLGAVYGVFHDGKPIESFIETLKESF
ncbi:glycerol-3-phosphate dehydrogenase 1-like protein [Clytia hemisphaerica]|uniref:Glycerol-3-phosphate dehydrogenase [NAD(+)] n=2 Tax=Clytia hemisphaerica TaxID=252671 RepID=A0A7M5U7Y6_9CNID